jgi:hypothetical protein
MKIILIGKNMNGITQKKILVNHKYSPILHIQKDSNGLIIPTKEFSKELQQEIFDYFASRNEDDK